MPLSSMELQHELGRLQRENELLREAVERLVEEREQQRHRRRRPEVDWSAALAKTSRFRRWSSPPIDCELCDQAIEGGEEFAGAGTKGSRTAHADCIRRRAACARQFDQQREGA
jgi:hypothetical protein